MITRLSLRDARRIAVRAQLLDADRPESLLDLVRHLTMLQVDLTTAVAPSPDVVCWSRLGPAYDPGQLDQALAAGDLVEHQLRIRPGEDMALHRAEMESWPGPEPLSDGQHAAEAWVGANDECRLEILEALRRDGPLPSSALSDSCQVPWRSSGWNHDRNRSRLLDLMAARGEVAVVGRQGRMPVWDLAERVYPDGPTVPLTEAHEIRGSRRLAALGIERARRAVVPDDDCRGVGEAGEVVTIDGLKGEWRADPAQLTRLGERFRGRTALLSPLDRLVFDRRRMAELWDFDYQLEMYKPAARRRWGYWALPVLHGDTLVGKVDATTDLDAGTLRLNAIHEDDVWSASLRGAVLREVRSLAGWLGVDLVDRRDAG